MPSSKDRITVWVVTPHASSEFDECWLPAETDEDDHVALAYAHARLEDLWDQYDSADPRAVKVTMEQREVMRWQFEEASDAE
jgi:hypothetical protein